MHRSRAALAGLAGAAAMGASTALEMRLRGRAASGVPADVLARIAPRAVARRLRGDERVRAIVSWTAPLPTALAAGVVGEAVTAALPEPAATGVYFGLVCLPDVALAPLAGAAPPPWRWGARELAISLGHHAVFVAGARAGASAAPARRPGRRGRRARRRGRAPRPW
ncbi:MAG TPA: hypothetical protein VH276_08535 [Solirubrobacteraceae bacterium]|jgi:hypothetical protein|nr:hypothetical protein [Solirubrobacteraceae bacterium]